VEIIQGAISADTESGEQDDIEVDMNDLGVSTLRKLDRYVTASLKKDSVRVLRKPETVDESRPVKRNKTSQSV